jgi:hypothetical protein
MTAGASVVRATEAFSFRTRGYSTDTLALTWPP